MNRFVVLPALYLVAAAVHADDEMQAGRRLFTEAAKPACAACHTLAAAQANGGIGPPLDELKPDAARVARALRTGVGAMPSYQTTLTDAQIELLARYVARATGAE